MKEKARTPCLRGMHPWIALVVLALASAGCTVTPGTVQVGDAWSWPTAPGEHVDREQTSHSPEPEEELGPGVVYLTIVNDSPRDDRLLSARASICRTTELHETKQLGGRMRMVPVTEGVAIPKGHAVALAPGGIHVMLLDLHHDLLLGERFELVLVFEEAGEIEVVAEVRKP